MPTVADHTATMKIRSLVPTCAVNDAMKALPVSHVTHETITILVTSFSKGRQQAEVPSAIDGARIHHRPFGQR